MLDHEDLKWIATTSTELNSILQQVSRYADLAQSQRGAHNYIELLGERVELATRKGQALFDRVTSKILAGATRKSASGRKGTARFTVVPPPVHTNTSPLSVPASWQSVQKAIAARPASLANGKENEPAPDTSEILTDARVKNPKGNREYILLVEDEPQVAELASGMLADEGYRVIIAGDGFEALKIYERIGKQIGLVILDFFLPVMDGDAVFDELLSINPTVDVVLSSGFAEQSKISSMLGQGLRGFIPKPYSREKLLEQVRSTLDAPRQAH